MREGTCFFTMAFLGARVMLFGAALRNAVYGRSTFTADLFARLGYPTCCVARFLLLWELERALMGEHGEHKHDQNLV